MWSSTDVPALFTLILFLLKFDLIHDVAAQSVSFVPSAKWNRATESNLDNHLKPNFGDKKLSWRDSHLTPFLPKKQEVDDDKIRIFGTSRKSQVPKGEGVNREVKSQTLSALQITNAETNRNGNISSDTSIISIDELELQTIPPAKYESLRNSLVTSNNITNTQILSNSKLDNLSSKSSQPKVKNAFRKSQKELEAYTSFKTEDNKLKFLRQNSSDETVLTTTFLIPHLDNFTPSILQPKDEDTLFQISPNTTDEVSTQGSQYTSISLITNEDALEYITESNISTQVLISSKNYPYIVSIWLRYDTPEYHAVGTLVSLRHVLTAAHSICWKSDGETPVLFDNHMIGVRVTSGKSTDQPVEYDVLQTLVHLKWWQSKQKVRSYDSAVLVLKKPVKLDLWSSLVEIVPLKYFMVMTSLYNYTDCVSVFWSHDQVNGSIDNRSLRLMTTKTNLISFDECNLRIIEENLVKIDKSLELCGVSKKEGALCQDVSDRVLICEGKLVGILSGTGGCVGEDRLQIFTRVDNLKDWIQEQMTPTNKTPSLKQIDEFSDNNAFNIFPVKLPIVLTAIMTLL